MELLFICVLSSTTQKTPKTPYKTSGEIFIKIEDSLRILIKILIRILRRREVKTRSKVSYKDFQALPWGRACERRHGSLTEAVGIQTVELVPEFGQPPIAPGLYIWTKQFDCSSLRLCQ